jgi:hypothetical protein
VAVRLQQNMAAYEGSLHWVDYGVIVAYFIAIIVVGFKCKVLNPEPN